MTADIARLILHRGPKALRALVTTPSRAGTTPAGRLLELRDAAQEQQLARAAVEACAAAVLQELGSLRATVEQRMVDVAALATELGLAVAREIVGDALERRNVDLVPIVRRCLQACVTSGDRTNVVLRVCPADQPRLVELAESQQIRLVADESLAVGSVRLETATGSVAYQPQEVLQRLSDDLRRELACP